MITEANSVIAASEGLLVELAMLMARGNGGTEEAHLLRDQFSDNERSLRESDVTFLRQLSSDLYSLEDDEIFEEQLAGNMNPRDLALAIYTAYHGNNWPELLKLLRCKAEFIPTFARAWLRGNAYLGMSRYASAWAFFTLAAKLDEDRTASDYMAMFALRKWKPEEASQESRRVVQNPGSAHPALVIQAANTLLAYNYASGTHSQSDVMSAAHVLVEAIGAMASSGEAPSEVTDSGYSGLAACFGELGDYAAEAKVLGILIERDPYNLMALEQKKAADELERIGSSVDSGILTSSASIAPMAAIRPDSFVAIVTKVIDRQLQSVA